MLVCGAALASRAYSTNRCLTAMWSASSSSRAFFSVMGVMFVAPVSFSQKRRVHLAAEMPVPRDVGDELGRCRFGVRRGGQDQARAALRDALVHAHRQAGLKQQGLRGAEHQDGLAVAK